MRIRGISTIAAVAVTAGALAGCNGSSTAGSGTGSGATTPAASTTSTAATPSRTTTAAPSKTTATKADATKTTASPSGSSASQDELKGKIIAGAPPQDLTWLVRRVPSSWKKVTNVGSGQSEWSIGGRCAVLLDQPAGIGTQPQPDSRGVLEHTADRTGQAFPGKPKPKYVAGAQKQHTLPNVVTGLNGITTAKFEEDVADYGKGRAQFLAYRNGDFALTFTGVCGTKAGFAAKKNVFESFISDLSAHTTY